MSEYFPDIAWRTILTNVTLTATDYHYDVTVSPEDPNEPGADPITVDTDCWVIDYAGYTYQITAINGNILTIYDINERSWGGNFLGPTPNMEAYVYKPKNGAFLLTQAQLRYLDKSAPDKIYPVEKGISWKYRGIKLDDGITIKENITEIALEGFTITDNTEEGWQGGNKILLINDSKSSNVGFLKFTYFV